MKKLLLAVLIALTLAPYSFAQRGSILDQAISATNAIKASGENENTPQDEIAESSNPLQLGIRSPEHKWILSQIREGRQNGLIDKGMARGLRIAAASPGYRKHVMNAVALEIESEPGKYGVDVPRNAQGQMQPEKIDWPGLTGFIEIFLPLLLEILKELLGGGL